MLLLYGIHRLNDRRTGYRNDYCLSCERQGIEEQFKSLNVGHLFFVPLLPLGYRECWQCRACGNDPHVAERGQLLRHLQREPAGSVLSNDRYYR